MTRHKAILYKVLVERKTVDGRNVDDGRKVDDGRNVDDRRKVDDGRNEDVGKKVDVGTLVVGGPEDGDTESDGDVCGALQTNELTQFVTTPEGPVAVVKHADAITVWQPPAPVLAVFCGLLGSFGSRKSGPCVAAQFVEHGATQKLVPEHKVPQPAVQLGDGAPEEKVMGEWTPFVAVDGGPDEHPGGTAPRFPTIGQDKPSCAPL